MVILYIFFMLLLFAALCLGLAALFDYNQWREDVINHRVGTCRPGCRPCADARERDANGLYSRGGSGAPPSVRGGRETR